MGYGRELFRVGTDSVLPTLTPAQVRSAVVGKPARRRGGVPMNVARMMSEAARAAARSAGEPANDVGPEIKVRPFDPGSVSVGAVGAKALLSYMAGVRGRANYRAERDRLAQKEARDTALAESTLAANAARAASYDRANTGGMTDYQRESLDWMKDPKNPRNRPKSNTAGGVMGAALLNLGYRAQQDEAAAAGLLTPEDDAAIRSLREDALTGAPGTPMNKADLQRFNRAVRTLGITNAEMKYATEFGVGSKEGPDPRGAWLQVVNEAVKRHAAARSAERKRAALTAGSAASRAMLSRVIPGYPAMDVGGGDTAPDWRSEVLRSWDEQDAED